MKSTIQLLNDLGTNLNDDGNVLEWDKELLPFGVLRDGISQIRLRRGSDPTDKDNDIIGRLESHPTKSNLLSCYYDSSAIEATHFNQ